MKLLSHAWPNRAWNWMLLSIAHTPLPNNAVVASLPPRCACGLPRNSISIWRVPSWWAIKHATSRPASGPDAGRFDWPQSGRGDGSSLRNGALLLSARKSRPGGSRLDRNRAVRSEQRGDESVRTGQLAQWLAKFPAKRILIVGDVILDEYLWGNVRRISPEAPVPVVEIRSRTFVPGGAGNAAANVVSLGGHALWEASLAATTRPLSSGRRCTGRVWIPADWVADAERSTTTKTRLIAHSQQVVRMDSEQAHASIPVRRT